MYLNVKYEEAAAEMQWRINGLCTFPPFRRGNWWKLRLEQLIVLFQ